LPDDCQCRWDWLVFVRFSHSTGKRVLSEFKQFTADASHELRNPIATIQTNVQMAIAYPQTGDQRLQVIERLTERLGNLVNDLLFLARSDSGIVQPIDQAVPLDALLMEVVEEQRLIADKQGICLSLSIVEPTKRIFPTAMKCLLWREIGIN